MTHSLKILIIDDDKVDAIAIVRSITRSDIDAEIDSAHSAKEGFQKLENSHYDLIFLDYMMPDSDGISILKKLRSLDIETPVIFITSQGDEKIASQAILAGASDYMPKTLLTSDGISHSVRTALKLHENQKLRKNAELELKINSNRLSEAQKLAKIGSWEINLNDGAIYFSEELYNILELDVHEEPSIALLESFFTSTEDIILFEKKLRDVQINYEQTLFSHTILDRKGTVKYINEYIKCLTDDNDKPYRILGTIQDVSIQKEIEKELIEAKNLAEQSVKLKERFLTNMSHEIRTPMNGVIGFAKILEETNLDENQSQSVKAIRTAGENLMTIINDILDLSKIEADKIVFEAIPFSVRKTVNAITELFTPAARDKKVTFTADISPTISDLLVGDPTRLTQILINLAGNALKFTNSGSVLLRVTEEDECDIETCIRFSIIDTGIGIPEDMIHSIFDSFNQASNETTRKYGGSGLGLTITKKLVELQGGIISLESEVAVGSTFSFMIKYKKAQKDFTVSLDEKKTTLDPVFLKDIKILLVEDNELNQLLTVKLFKKWNKEIDIAENGAIAIEKINSNTYDIILMDIQMPEMDGNEVTKYIREAMAAPKSQVAIIAMTAHATVDEEKRCIANGMNDYLSKPFDFNVLLEKLYRNINLDAEVSIVKSATKPLITSECLVNFDYLIDFSENDAYFIKEVIELFLEDAPGTLVEITEAANNENNDNLKKAVHKFKSSVSIFGIQKVLDTINIIENELQTNPSGSLRYEAVVKLNELCLKAINELKNRAEYI